MTTAGAGGDWLTPLLVSPIDETTRSVASLRLFVRASKILIRFLR
jgi:hypothetical protein